MLCIFTLSFLHEEDLSYGFLLVVKVFSDLKFTDHAEQANCFDFRLDLQLYSYVMNIFNPFVEIVDNTEKFFE